MKTIQTVTGPAEIGTLGRVLVHEHCVYGFCGFQGDMTYGPFDEGLYIKRNIEEMAKAKKYGIQTIVDATTNECGRDPEFLRKVSMATGMNIICSTGYYFEDQSAFAYWKFRSGFADIDTEIYEMMKREVTEGIGRTGIKAGVIKLASSQGEITPVEQKFFRAAAQVNKECGTPIITHTQGGTMGPEQAKLLIENGADPKRVSIGHMCGNTDIAYHEETLKQGVYDSFDRFGLEGELFHTPTDEERCDVLATLFKKGYGKQLLMAHDSVTVELGRPRPVPKEELDFMQHAQIGNIGERIIPMLKERGLTDADIDTILEANPHGLLGG